MAISMQLPMCEHALNREITVLTTSFRDILQTVDTPWTHIFHMSPKVAEIPSKHWHILEAVNTPLATSRHLQEQISETFSRL